MVLWFMAACRTRDVHSRRVPDLVGWLVNLILSHGTPMFQTLKLFHKKPKTVSELKCHTKLAMKQATT